MTRVKHHKMYEASLSQFRAQRDRALAILDIYYNKSVGVGEHPTHLEDISQLLKDVAEAEECMKVLTKHFGKHEHEKSYEQNRH